MAIHPQQGTGYTQAQHCRVGWCDQRAEVTQRLQNSPSWLRNAAPPAHPGDGKGLIPTSNAHLQHSKGGALADRSLYASKKSFVIHILQQWHLRNHCLLFHSLN